MNWQICTLILTSIFGIGNSQFDEKRSVTKSDLRANDCPVTFEVLLLQSMTDTPKSKKFVENGLYFGICYLAADPDPLLEDAKITMGYFGDTRAPYFGVGKYFGTHKNDQMKKDEPYKVLGPLSTDWYNSISYTNTIRDNLVVGGDIPNNLYGAILSGLVDSDIGFSTETTDSKNRPILKVVIAVTDSMAHEPHDLVRAANRYNDNFCNWGDPAANDESELLAEKCKPGTRNYELCMDGDFRGLAESGNMNSVEKEMWNGILEDCGPHPFDQSSLLEHPMEKDQANIDYWKPPQLALVKEALTKHEQMYIVTMNYDSEIMTLSQASKYMSCSEFNAGSVPKCLKMHHERAFTKEGLPGVHVVVDENKGVDEQIKQVLATIADMYCNPYQDAGTLAPSTTENPTTTEMPLTTTTPMTTTRPMTPPTPAPTTNEKDILGCADCVEVNKGRLYLRYDHKNMPKEIADLLYY